MSNVLQINEEKSRVKMTLGFAYSSVAHVIASFLGSGVLRPASGTWGTLAGAVVFSLLNPYFSLLGWILLIAVTFFVGAWACEKTGEDIGVHDHSSIVIDEVFAIWMVLVTVPASIGWQFAGFIAFRFFDIVKVPPANYFDENCTNGWGVMLDDFVAGVYAIAVLQIAQKVCVLLGS